MVEEQVVQVNKTRIGQRGGYILIELFPTHGQLRSTGPVTPVPERLRMSTNDLLAPPIVD